MDTIIWLVLRRLRAPLLLLIGAYAISVAGLVLIPGTHADGEPWRMDFLHAFYFVSYMGSTIGFGEIPYDFNAAQRLWVTFTIFLTVISWLYAIGRIIGLIQEAAFRSAVAEAAFVRAVRRLRAPFWVISGYGETGSLLVRALNRRGLQCVVMDRRATAINQLQLENYGPATPSLCGNATDALQLLEAGMRRRLCRGVVAMTDSNEDNIRISVSAKLIRPELRVIARAGTQEAADNLRSFDTDHVIHAYSVFGDHLAMTQQRPSLHLLHAWLISLPGRKPEAPARPPKGHWIICGYGRFGQAAARALEAAGNTLTIIDHNPDKVPAGAVIGRGTNAEPLREAGVVDAVGIVCGLDSDPNTLSAVMTARDINPDIYVIARQDRRADSLLFKAAPIDMIMEVSRLTVWRILPLITSPLLAKFLATMRRSSEERAREVLNALSAHCGEQTPECWHLTLDEAGAPALQMALRAGLQPRIDDLLRDPRDREQRLGALPLMLVRDGRHHLQPEGDVALAAGDELLLCTRSGHRRLLERVLFDPRECRYVLHGEDSPDGWLWRWWLRRRARKSSA